MRYAGVRPIECCCRRRVFYRILRGFWALQVCPKDLQATLR